ncbi:MAG: SulP family inorganic anion transporter [Candidatus Babeliales bacterium]
MNFWNKIQTNLQSGLTVALVSIPLSISLAIASHTTPVVGIITAIWAGLIASLFGGSNFNIIGPTGALSGVLATYAIAHGAASLPSLAIASGLIIIAAYFLHLERYLIFVPASTIHGFTLGIACIIVISQLTSALGITGLPTHEHCINNLKEILGHLDMVALPTAVMFLCTLAGLFISTCSIPSIPSAIIITPIGIALGYFMHMGYLPYHIQTLGDRFGSITAQLVHYPSFIYTNSLAQASIVVALIAILETMISARIADGMTKTKHNKKKELFGLGIANIVSGFVGGMPATAALARTALNIKSGATSKLSATIGSIFIALISLALLTYFSFIPMAVIAAILVYTAYRMIEHEHFIRMYRLDKMSFGLSLLVAFITIYADPMMGIVCGIACALIIFMEQLSHGHYELEYAQEPSYAYPGSQTRQASEDREDGTAEKTYAPLCTLIYSFKGHLVYINGQTHVARLETTPTTCKTIIFNLHDLYFIDLDGIDILDELIEFFEQKNITVFIVGTPVHITSLLTTSTQYQALHKSGRVLPSVTDALNSLRTRQTR